MVKPQLDLPSILIKSMQPTPVRNKFHEHIHMSKVDYGMEPAEHVSLGASSTDLVTVAVAIHWFNFDEFYREVKRVPQAGRHSGCLDIQPSRNFPGDRFIRSTGITMKY